MLWVSLLRLFTFSTRPVSGQDFLAGDVLSSMGVSSRNTQALPWQESHQCASPCLGQATSEKAEALSTQSLSDTQSESPNHSGHTIQARGKLA